MAATAAAFVRTVSDALEANGGIHEKHTTLPRVQHELDDLAALARLSSHVRLDDVTGGASAMVSAPVPAERLAGGAVGGGAARLGRVVGDRADDDDVGLSARVCAIESGNFTIVSIRFSIACVTARGRETGRTPRVGAAPEEFVR